ncbi:MAG: hypothetical protein GY906_39025 [bacterium]|nr:hypothetical protein [bacterium]
MKIEKLIKLIKATTKPTRTTPAGSTLYDWFYPDERYVVDFADDFKPDWQQFDTDQDASYFGVWFNPVLLVQLSYAEGDWMLLDCRDVEHYNAEVQAACDFYDAGRIAKAVNSAGSVTISQDRENFFITDPADTTNKVQAEASLVWNTLLGA